MLPGLIGRGLQAESDLPIRVKLEHSARRVFPDQRVAIGQPLASKRAAALLFRGAVLEGHLLFRGDLGYRFAIGKQDIAIGQHPNIVRELGGILPHDLARRRQNHQPAVTGRKDAAGGRAGKGRRRGRGESGQDHQRRQEDCGGA